MTSLLCMGGTKRSDASDNTECRPANIEKFLSESFSGQSRGGQGKAEDGSRRPRRVSWGGQKIPPQQLGVNDFTVLATGKSFS